MVPSNVRGYRLELVGKQTFRAAPSAISDAIHQFLNEDAGRANRAIALAAAALEAYPGFDGSTQHHLAVRRRRDSGSLNTVLEVDRLVLATLQITPADHGVTVLEIYTALTHRNDPDDLALYLLDLGTRFTHWYEDAQARRPGRARPTDQLFEQYYRQRARGKKVSLKRLAEQSGYTYAYLRKAKVEYDRRLDAEGVKR